MGASQEAAGQPLGALLAVWYVGEHVPGECGELRDDAHEREELHLEDEDAEQRAEEREAVDERGGRALWGELVRVRVRVSPDLTLTLT